jgi:hypothetical protein
MAAAVANGTHTGHQFSVTETGGATISIPIQVPRGIGGMEPQLSLNYSSGAGNGLLGIGWTLAGPSAITRCPKTAVHDAGVRGAVSFSTSDRFCLDGQRLISVNPTTDATYGAAGTEYRTERDSFSRILAVGNTGGSSGYPASFKVLTKAGLILEFGLSDNSRAMTVMTGGAANVVNRWLLQRISDRMVTPSFVEFVYCGGEVTATFGCTASAYAGSKVLRYIQYTNRGTTLNGTTAVVFSYEARPDRQLQFHAGASQVQTQRLAYIGTHLGFVASTAADQPPTSLGSRVKFYEFTYDPMTNASGQWTRVTNVSRLVRIQEVRGLASDTRPPPSTRSATDALPPLDFEYAADMVYGKGTSQNNAAGTSASPPAPRCGGYVGVLRINQLCP